MDIIGYYKSMVRGSYDTGLRLTNMLTRNMSSRKAALVGTAADVGLGALLTWITVPGAIQSLTGAVAAVTAAAAAPTAIPSALLAVAGATFAVGFGVPMVAMVAGFANSACARLHLPTPAGVVHTANRVAHVTADTVSKPFKWAGSKLSHAFKKAHDGADAVIKHIPNPIQKRVPGRHGHFDI